MKRILLTLAVLQLSFALFSQTVVVGISNSFPIEACRPDTIHVTVKNSGSTLLTGIIVNMKISTPDFSFNGQCFNSLRGGVARPIPTAIQSGLYYKISLDSLNTSTNWTFDFVLNTGCSVIPDTVPSNSGSVVTIKDTADRVSVYVSGSPTGVTINNNTPIDSIHPYKVLLSPILYPTFDFARDSTSASNSSVYTRDVTNNGDYTGCANLGDTIIRRSYFINKGSSVFRGGVSIKDTMGSCNSMTIISAKVTFGTTSVSLSSADILKLTSSGYKYNLAANGVFVDYSIDTLYRLKPYIVLEEKILISSCLSSSCKSKVSMIWGCDTNSLCKTKIPPPYTYTTSKCANPQLYISRITPSGNTGSDNYWDSTCIKKNNNWEFVVQNVDTNTTAFNVHVVLNINDIGSYTYIGLDTAFKMGYSKTGYGYGLSASDTLSYVIDTLKPSDFSANRVPSCLSSGAVNTPIQKMDIRISRLVKGEKFFFRFRTYQCCPSDTFLYGGGFNMNRWTINASASSCSLTDTFPATGYGASSGNPPYYYPYAPNLGGGAYAGNISTYFTDANQDYSLAQVFSPTINNMTGGHGTCGETDTFHIENFTLASLYDYQLLFGHGNSAGNGFNGNFRFVVVFDTDTGLRIQNTSSVTIQGLGITWPSSQIVNTPNHTEVLFDLSTLISRDTAISGLGGAQAFAYFLANSNLYFPLTACCPAKPVSNCRIRFKLWPRWNVCDTCMIPLSQTSTNIFVHCPGCITPGIIADKAVMQRINFGLPDSLNNGLSTGTTPITPTYNYFNQVNNNAAIAGDTIKSTVSGFFVDGDQSSGGVAYSQWQHYWSLQGRTDTFYKYLFLEHNIPNSGSLTTNFKLLKDTLYYQVNGTGTPLVIPLTSSNVNRVGDDYIYRVSIDQIRTATGNNSLRFQVSDRYTFTSYYTVCNNYDLSGALPAYSLASTTTMYFTTPLDSSLTAHFSNDPVVGDYYNHHRRTGNVTSPDSINPATPIIYLCEAYGCNNYIYFLGNRKTSQSIDVTPPFSPPTYPTSRCTKLITETVTSAILGPVPHNNFPFEYRPIPRLLSGNTIGISDTNSSYAFLFAPPVGCYQVSPVSTQSSLYTYISNAAYNYFTFTDYNPLDIRVRTSGNTQILKFKQGMFTFGNQSLAGSSLYGNSVSNLPLGDEYFTQTLTFNLKSICTSCADTLVLLDSACAKVIYPPQTLCSGSGLPDSLYDNNAFTLIKTHAVITPSILPLTAVTTNSFTLTQNITMSRDNPDNLYFYIDTNLIASGLSIDSITPPARDTAVKIGKYLVFKAGYAANYTYSSNNGLYYYSNSTTAFKFWFHLTKCPVANLNDTIGIPFYANWSCSGFPTSLPDTTCHNPVKDSFTVVLKPAQWGNPTPSQPTTFNSCDTLRFTSLVQSLGEGQITNVFDSLIIPTNLTLVPNSIKVTYGGSTVAVAAGNISQPITNHYWINLNPSITSPVFSGTVSLTLSFSVIPNCKYNGTAPVNTFYGTNYCGGVINSISPTFTALTFAGNNHCGQPAIHTDSLIGTSCYGDSSGSIKLSITSGVSPYVYTWSPSVSTTQSAYHLAPGVYSIKVRGADSCATTVLDTVLSNPACCKANNTALSSSRNDSLTFNNAMTSSQLLSQLTAIFPANVSGTTIQNLNYQIVINNLLTLNGNLTFLNCPNITFGKNGGIAIQGAYTLSITSSTLKACGPNMWQGIYVSNSAGKVLTQKQTPTSSLSSIQDALYGVYLIVNGCAHIKDCDFVNDWNGIYCETGYGFTPDSFTVVNSKFRTSGALKYVANNTSNSRLSDIGIKVVNTGNPSTIPFCKIGSPDTTLGNLFDTINCGISASNLSLKSTNNTFSHLPQAWQSSQPTYWGRGIYYRTPIVTSGSASQKDSLLVNTSGIPATANKFIGCYTAIDMLGSAVADISGNTFDFTTSSWISVNSDRWMPNINVHNNTFSSSGSTGTRVGILFQSCDRSNINIQSNNLSVVNGSVTFLPTPSVGIEINSYVYDTVSKYYPTISNNYITNSQYGIMSYITDHLLASGNTAFIKTIPDGNAGWFGFWSWMDKNASISNNTIYNTLGTAGMTSLPYTADANLSNKLIGIQISAQGVGNTVGCNYIDNMQWSINATGASANQLNLFENIMYNSLIGAVISNSGYIGCIGCNLATSGDNSWFNCTNHLGIMIANGSTQAWLLRTPAGFSSTNFYPSPLYQFNFPNSGASPSFNILNNGGTQTFKNCSAALPLKIDTASIPYSSQLDSIALGTVQYASFQTDNMSWAREQLIQLALEHPEILDSSYVIQHYIDSTANDAFALLQTINYKMKLETDSINLRNMQVYNSSTAPDNIRTLNTQIVNNLYLKYFAITPNVFYQTDSLMTATDLDTLLSIAEQCYVVGGPAVLQARSMYWTATNSMDASFQDYCLNTTGFYKTDPPVGTVSETFRPYSFKVYPNPMGKENTVNVISSESGEISFYNELGQLVYTSPIYASNNVFDCNQLNCDVNLLLYKAKLNNGKIENGKIIIIR